MSSVRDGETPDRAPVKMRSPYHSTSGDEARREASELMGWGIPLVVLSLSLLVGVLYFNSSSSNISKVETSNPTSRYGEAIPHPSCPLNISNIQLHCASTLSFTSEDGLLKANGRPIIIKGANWFGFETRQKVVHGLWKRDYRDYLDFLVFHHFNALRIPLHLELVLRDGRHSSVEYGNMNEDLQRLSSLTVLDKIVKEAGRRGILVMFDLHSFKPDAYANDGLWYDENHPESMVLQFWNEPFGVTWGGSEATDWHAAAQRIGNYILSLPGGDRFLIFVAGTHNSPSCEQPCFWGENLQGVQTLPIQLINQKKLVYSPHTYGPSVSNQSYFDNAIYPGNMASVWDAHWGTVSEQTGQATVLGEWGAMLGGKNDVWLETLVDYLVEKNMGSQFFWCLNGNSDKTGGLLKSDWKTPDLFKLRLLSKLPCPTRFSKKQNEFCVS